MEQDNLVNHLAKLQWACRRGMLELDVLLGNFLKEAYPHLTLEEKKQFIVLLNCEDTDLFDWLLGQVTPQDTALVHITEAIRRYARSRL